MQPGYLTIPQLAPVVVDAALRCVSAFADAKKAKWCRPADFVVLGTVEIAYQEPDRLTNTSCHQLQIWKDRKIVLCAMWEQALCGPYKVLKLRRGAWIDEILRAAEFVAQDAISVAY